jgi:myo-inositol-1(or 4)-monophosphatase
MKKIESDKRLKLALKLVKEASKIVLKYYQNLDNLKYSYKGTEGIATIADLKVEEFLMAQIKKMLPHDFCIGEETFQKNKFHHNGWCWYIDPIDGTNNYARGINFFCISIGITFNGAQQIGVVLNPVNNECYFASKGQGAFLLKNKKLIALKPLKVEKSVKESIFSATTIPKKESQTKEQILKLNFATRDAMAKRRLGSAALEICMVASGSLDGYWGRNLKPWDILGAGLIASEAGMKVTDLFTKPFQTESDSILVLQPTIQRKLSAKIRQTK